MVRFLLIIAVTFGLVTSNFPSAEREQHTSDTPSKQQNQSDHHIGRVIPPGPNPESGVQDLTVSKSQEVLKEFAVNATSLKCHSCDSFINCGNPLSVSCPPHAKCYTLTKDETILAKGCAHSCDAVTFSAGTNCTTCHNKDHCNGPELPVGGETEMKKEKPAKQVKEEEFAASNNTSLKCFSCEYTESCDRPKTVSCTNSKCFTLMKGGDVNSKGCATSCNDIAFSADLTCSICHDRDHCNGPKIEEVKDTIQEKDSELKLQREKEPDGTVNNFSFGLIMTVPVFRRFFM